MTQSPATIARHLVDDPDKYSEYRHAFRREVEYYRQVRNAAPKTLPEFEEYLRLHKIFLERSHGTCINEWVEENLARSLKNMILETSPRGRAYPISTLEEVRHRLQQYRDLGIDTPEYGVVVETVVEALFTGNGTELQPGAGETFTGLLSETPSFEQVGGPTELLARLKAAQSLSSHRLGERADSPEEELELAAREYHAATQCPSAPDGADACIAAANGIPPGNKTKRKLLAAAVHQDPTRVEAFWELLYWSARETIERFRHLNERPTLGRLYGARFQLGVVDSYTEVVRKSASWQRRIDSYRHVISGIEGAQGHYTTTRENWPDVDFQAAATAYESAAEMIAPVDRSRQLKYQSKAYRYRAHAAETPRREYQIHGEAIEWLLSSTEDHDRELIQDLVCHHHFQRVAHDIKRSFAARDYDEVIRQYRDYHTLRRTLPRVTDSEDIIDACYHLAMAMRMWHAGDGQNTWYHIRRVDELELSDSQVSTDELTEHVATPEILEASRTATAVTDMTRELKLG